MLVSEKSGRNIVLVLLFMSFTGFLQSSDIQLCEIRGKIADEITGEGLPFASLQIVNKVGVKFSSFAITDINGDYIITDVPFGEYTLLVSYMGYKKQEITILADTRKLKFNVNLSKESYSLNEINITAEKQLVQQGIEKTTVNIEKNTTLIGGSAVDVLQSLPSVDYDINGQLQYRGSDKVTLLLNGNRSELVKSLDQIPSDQIEKIEIINNPSAKYDAEGMSGIINIVLKSGNKGKNKTSVLVYAGLPETMGGNAGYSGVTDKCNYHVVGGYNHKTKFQTKEHLRKNYESFNAHDYYQYDRQDEILNDVFLNAGYNQQIRDNQQLGLSLIGSKKFNTADRNIRYVTLENDQSVFESKKEIDIRLDNYSLDGNAKYTYKFSGEGQKIYANFHYSILNQLHEMDNRYYPEYSIENQQLQNTKSIQKNKEGAFSLNYTQSIGNYLLFETGYQLSGKNLLNDFKSESYESYTEIWKSDTSLNNKFHYIQNIHGFYIDIKAKFKHFDLQSGLRGEYTSNHQIDKQKDDYFNIFPSVTISRRHTDNTSIYISYNRRINRPTIKMLNPYTNEYADILNMHIGNPDLKPEYVNTLETGVRLVFEKLSGSGSVYYRNIDQAISRVKSASNDSALIVTFMNLNNAKILGGEIAFSLKATKWWNISTSGNVFYTTLKGKYGPNTIVRSHVGWTGNIANKFKLPAGIGLQIIGYYRSKLPDVMGTYMERYYIDLALNKRIIKDRGRLVFKISDLFNTYRYGLDLEGVDDSGYKYSQVNRRKNESQYFIVSFIYNIDGKEKKKKKSNFYLESFGK